LHLIRELSKDEDIFQPKWYPAAEVVKNSSELISLSYANRFGSLGIGGTSSFAAMGDISS
jgi:hypothetical protein